MDSLKELQRRTEKTSQYNEPMQRGWRKQRVLKRALELGISHGKEVFQDRTRTSDMLPHDFSRIQWIRKVHSPGESSITPTTA